MISPEPLHGFSSYSHCCFVLLASITESHTKTFDLLLHLWRHLFIFDLIG